ncbi:MAG: hypothetical protein LBF60_10745, partial [Treponema sp.]|nr:hypothetical protein [Treponema sp.]
MPALSVGGAAAAIVKDVQNANILNVSIAIPDGATPAHIALTDGANFTFSGKTFNFNITFASGVYDETMVDAIKGKFTAKGASVGETVATPDNPNTPDNPDTPDNPEQPGPTETLPALSVGTATATITKDAQNADILNVSITIPNGTSVSQIALTDGANFTFNGKTFNFDITFASGAYDDSIVEAIKGKFAAKEGATVGAVNTTPAKPEEPPVNTPQPATLKIDGALITIPVPAEGVNTINVSAVVSDGVVADFSDPSGILAGKTINLILDTSVPAAGDGLKRINCSAISAIENAFKAKGASPLSNTTGGVIPVFDTTSLKNGVVNDDLASLAQRAAAQTPEVKIVNGIKALYNGGNQVLKVESPMQLAGDIWCSQLDRIQTTQGNIHADETLRLWESGGEINNPRRKRRGIEDFSLKSLRMRGNKSPAPPVLTAPRGGV